MLKEKAIIYGIGKFYKEIEAEIRKNYEVIAKTDKNMNKEEVIPLNDALILPYDIILITILDIRICFEVIAMLGKKYGVPYYKIALGANLKMQKKWDSLYISANGDIVYKVDSLKIITKNIDAFNNIKDIFYNNCYNYFIGDDSKEIVIDIGMNIGGASLFFANKDNVKKVYGFEPFKDTFIQAKKNYEANNLLKDKIEYYQYSVSNVNEYREILYNEEMTCGQSTDLNANEKARNNYKNWKLISQSNDKLLRVEVKDIKNILLKIYELHREENVVLKMDCEGEEYRILERIDEFNLFPKIKIIMLEWHYGDDERILKILKRNGYVYWSFRHNEYMGMIYALLKKDEF